jgi:hypothetical protein
MGFKFCVLLRWGGPRNFDFDIFWNYIPFNTLLVKYVFALLFNNFVLIFLHWLTWEAWLLCVMSQLDGGVLCSMTARFSVVEFCRKFGVHTWLNMRLSKIRIYIIDWYSTRIYVIVKTQWLETRNLRFYCGENLGFGQEVGHEMQKLERITELKHTSVVTTKQFLWQRFCPHTSDAALYSLHGCLQV